MSSAAWILVLTPCVAAAALFRWSGTSARVGTVAISAAVGAVCLVTLSVAVAHHAVVMAPLGQGGAREVPTLSWTLAADASSVAWAAAVFLGGLATAGLQTRTSSGVSAGSLAVGLLGLAGCLVVVLADDLPLLFTGWTWAGYTLLIATGRGRSVHGRLAPAWVVSAGVDLLLLLGILAVYRSTGTLDVARARLELSDPSSSTATAGTRILVAAVTLAAVAGRSCVAAHVSWRRGRGPWADRATNGGRALPALLVSAYLAAAFGGVGPELGMVLVVLAVGLVLLGRVTSPNVGLRSIARRTYHGLVERFFRGIALVLVHGVDEVLFHGWVPRGEGIRGDRPLTASTLDSRCLLALLGLLVIAVIVLAVMEAPGIP
jgi:hypothetical protein